MNLERRAAGISLRLWVLVLNLIANVLLVHGAVHYLIRGTHLGETVAGLLVTTASIAVLSIPNR